MNYIVVNLLLALLPSTRFFGVKRFLLRHLGINVGRGTRICGGVAFYGAGQIVIGNESWIGIGCRFYTSLGFAIIIGDRCDIAPEVSFINGTHLVGDPNRRAGANKASDIRIGSGTWIGARTLIMGGADVGAASVVGANATLLPSHYPDSSLILGSPARATALP